MSPTRKVLNNVFVWTVALEFGVSVGRGVFKDTPIPIFMLVCVGIGLMTACISDLICAPSRP